MSEIITTVLGKWDVRKYTYTQYHLSKTVEIKHARYNRRQAHYEALTNQELEVQIIDGEYVVCLHEKFEDRIDELYTFLNTALNDKSATSNARMLIKLLDERYKRNDDQI